MKKVIEQAVLEAGDFLKSFKKKNKLVNYKNDDSLLTEADLTSLNILKKNLDKLNIPIYNEEEEFTDLPSEYIIIDPLDGTYPYFINSIFWGVILTYVKDNKPEISCVYLPDLNILIEADRESGVRINKEKTEHKGNFFGRRRTLGISLWPDQHLKEYDNEIRDLVKDASILYSEYASCMYTFKLANFEYDKFFTAGDFKIWDISAVLFIAELNGYNIEYRDNKSYNFDTQMVPPFLLSYKE